MDLSPPATQLPYSMRGRPAGYFLETMEPNKIPCCARLRIQERCMLRRK